MKIDFNKKVSKDTFYSLVPINKLLRATALSNMYRKGIQVKHSASLIKSFSYVIILGVANIFCFLEKMKTLVIPINGLFSFADCVQLTYWLSYFEYMIDLYYVSKYGRESVLNYLKNFDYIDTITDIRCCDEIRKSVLKITVKSLVIFFWITLFDLVSWAVVYDWDQVVVYSIEYLYFFLNMLTVLDIISQVIQVEYRLQMLGLLLQGCNSTANFIKPFHRVCIAPLETIFIVNKCYLLLLKQVTHINICYGVRILVYCLIVLINIINLLNLAIRICNGSLVTTYDEFIVNSTSFVCLILQAIASVKRAMNYKLMIYFLVHQCEQTYKQNELIIVTVDELLASNRNDNDFRKSLLELRNLLITRPIKFHAAKFFTMDYSLIVSLSSVIVTYTIIMLLNMQ